MTSLCFYFQVHQPMRLNRFSVFTENSPYFDDERNKGYLRKVARKCYLPTNKLLLDLINEYNGKFKIAFSLTGVFVEQCKKFAPEVIGSFQELAKTGNVEFLNETYYHSLAILFSEKEFIEQIKLHKKMILDLFNQKPKIFRNTEAMYSNNIARLIEKLGYKGIITEGHESVLGWRSPNYLYHPHGCKKISALLRNYKLSDDIGFRFSARWWEEYPLTADKYSIWLSKCEGQCINLFIDYETFGEHQWEDTGIFNFLRYLPAETSKYSNLDFKTPSEIVKMYKPVGIVDVPHTISWADVQRDLSAWLENEMQRLAFEQMTKLEECIKKNPELLHTWRLLQTSDHFYYMCTKWFADGDVHKYFNPYNSPYDAFINYMNILQDLKRKVGSK
ncbi:MAG: polysaccharide deacetylase family protein [Candidatus Aenigmarchaeota archaeon]|nr:polysaccharide deacetylase family protein [Candidatus Aenigmarchaeota archaeon]